MTSGKPSKEKRPPRPPPGRRPSAIDGPDGVLLVDKPAGPTSHDVVASVRRRFNLRKVGHGGTLDPGATGLLVILLGKGTSLSERIMGSDKRYTGEMLLGTTTDTQDIHGEIVATMPHDLVTAAALEREMQALRGDSYQIPPMVSAVKQGGVPLYKLARKGKTVERKERLIHVYTFRLLDSRSPVAAFDLACGKGTYVRTLCHDIGERLGCGACLQELRRTRSGHLDIADAIPLEEVLEYDLDALTARVVGISQFLAGASAHNA